MNNKWDGKVPDWELEPTGAEQKEMKEAGAEVVPSFAEVRSAEIAKETKEIPPEKPEQKAEQIEAVRAEIGAMAKLERAEQSPRAFIEVSKSPEKNIKVSVQKKKSAVDNFLGEERIGAREGIKGEIDHIKLENEIKINKSLKNSILTVGTVSMATIIGSLTAAGYGIGTATTMTALAIGTAPVAATLLAGAGVVWSTRRVWNAYKARKAMEEVYA